MQQSTMAAHDCMAKWVGEERRRGGERRGSRTEGQREIQRTGGGFCSATGGMV
jgi:hypothetical protein